MEGLYSRLCLENLMLSYSNIRGIVLPSHSSITHKPYPEKDISVLNPASVGSLAVHRKIPVYPVDSDRHYDYRDILSKAKPELIILAGFPYRLPASLFNYPRSGAYNVHPSLLPAYRGPVPLFWQFYFGEATSGITLHKIEETFDTGDIALQDKTALYDGISSKGATVILAGLAAGLIQNLIEGICSGTLNTHKQDESASSYYGWPDVGVFTIPVSWNARRAYNFICGTRHWNHAYRIVLDDREVVIKDTCGYSEGSEKPATMNGGNENVEVLPFSNGYLQVIVQGASD